MFVCFFFVFFMICGHEQVIIQIKGKEKTPQPALNTMATTSLTIKFNLVMRLI